MDWRAHQAPADKVGAARRIHGIGFGGMPGGGKEPTILPIHQGLVELEQRCRPDERAKLRNSSRTHEQRAESEYEAIAHGQIRRALPGLRIPPGEVEGQVTL